MDMSIRKSYNHVYARRSNDQQKLCPTSSDIHDVQFDVINLLSVVCKDIPGSPSVFLWAGQRSYTRRESLGTRLDFWHFNPYILQYFSDICTGFSAMHTIHVHGLLSLLPTPSPHTHMWVYMLWKTCSCSNKFQCSLTTYHKTESGATLTHSTQLQYIKHYRHDKRVNEGSYSSHLNIVLNQSTPNNGGSVSSKRKLSENQNTNFYALHTYNIVENMHSILAKSVQLLASGSKLS